MRDSFPLLGACEGALLGAELGSDFGPDLLTEADGRTLLGAFVPLGLLLEGPFGTELGFPPVDGEALLLGALEMPDEGFPPGPLLEPELTGLDGAPDVGRFEGDECGALLTGIEGWPLLREAGLEVG